MSIFLIFNKTTGKLVTMANSPDTFQNLANLLIKEVNIADLGLENGEFNLARFRWDGDYETGTLVDLFKEKKAVVDQDDIDRKYYELFFRKFPIEEVIFRLVKNLGDGDPMRGFLMKLLIKKADELQFYRNSPNHILQGEDEKIARLTETFTI